jgi:predicted transposase YbfD/YdcC
MRAAGIKPTDADSRALSIENSRHWTLDMAFNQNQNRMRRDHGDQNLAVLHRIALAGHSGQSHLDD